MITLHVYMNPKPGKELELETGIADKWLVAMAQQPGFAGSAVLTPMPGEHPDELGARKPESAFEVLSFWRSEEERLAWVARPIHNEVFLPLLELADVTFTVKDATHVHGIGA